MASEDVAVKRVALCSAVFAGFAYVGYSILKSAFCFKGNGRDDKGSRKLVKLKKKKKHKGEQPERDMSHRSSQTDLSVPPEDYITNSPAELHFIPKSVRNKVRELNLKARMFDDQYFARIFKPRSLQNSPWGSPKALSPVADGSCNNSYLSRSAENVHTGSTSPLKRRNSSRSSSRASQHWQCNDMSANHITEKSLYRAVVKETDELLQEVLHGLYNKARVMTLYEAKCLVTLLTSGNEDVLVKTLTTMSNCAAFTINQDYLCDVGGLPLLKDLLDHDCLAVQVAATQAIANMAVNERNQTLLQPCIPLLLSAAVSRDGGCYLQTVSLLCLTNLALCDETHEAFRHRLHHLCILVETADDSVRLQTLKLLVNLSCNSRMVPYLLAAKAPQNLFSLLEDSNREVTLRVLTYLANIVSCAVKKKLSLLDLPSEYRAAAPETLYAALWGAPSKEHLQSKTRTLILRADEDISFQAGRIFDALMREYEIEESVALVPDMVAEEKLKAVQFWNVVSERLQQIVNDSAADINALALNMHGEDISVATLGDQETQAKMSQPYMETHAYRSENLYTEAIEGFDVAHATSGGHQQELLALSAELEQVVPTQQPPTPANFGAVPLEHGLSVTPESLPKDSAVLLISTQASDDQASFDVAPQQSHVPLPQQDYGNVLQIGVKTASFQEHKEAPEEWQSCLEYAPKSKPQRKRRPSAKKAAKGYIKRIASLGGKRAAGASILGEPGHADASALDARLQGGQNVETAEVIVIQTRKRPKKTREGKDKQCKICLKELPNNSSLTTHMWTHEKPFACTECSACFSTKNNLIVHQRSHSGEKPYACGECSASFSTRGNLKRHVKTHTGVKPWKCSHCEQCFTEKKTLVAHMRRHTGEKPYQCQVCQRRFAQSGVLQTHMAVHLGHKAHLCEHCGKAFRQRSQLRLHMQRHQGLRRYSCTICPSRFLTKADMLRHERTHTGERPYGCTLCGKKFTRQQSLNEHTNRHYGIKPFECKYCDKTFAEMSACYKHIKLHSKNENGENAEGAQSSAKASEASFPATSLVPAAETVQLCPAPAASGTRGEGSEQRVLQREATLQPLLQQQQRRRQQSPAPGTADVAGMGSTAEVSATDLLAAASGF